METYYELEGTQRAQTYAKAVSSVELQAELLELAFFLCGEEVFLNNSPI